MQHPIGWIQHRLEGWPDISLTILLLALASVLVLIALLGQPTLKALAAAWVLFP